MKTTLLIFALLVNTHAISRVSPVTKFVGDTTSVFSGKLSSEAQESGARMLDEFGGINYSDMLARIDNFAVELQTNPQVRGFIVVFPPLTKIPAWYIRRAYWCKGYLTQARGVELSRVVVLNGGFSDEVKFQLWVVPPGVESPVPPFDVAAALSREKTPFLFDRRVFENSPPVAEVEVEMHENYLSKKDIYEPFVTVLRSDPASRGFIVGYARRINRHGTDRKMAAREKLSILKLHSIGADRIVAVGGGLRNNRTIEYWFVPPGAELPKPTPSVRPKKRKH